MQGEPGRGGQALPATVEFDWIVPAAGVHVIHAVVDHHVVGHLRVQVARPGSKRFKVEDIQVDKPYWRQGIATALALTFHDRMPECTLHHYDFITSHGAYWGLSMARRYPEWNTIRAGGPYGHLVRDALRREPIHST